MNYGRALKIARAFAGITREELAAAACVDASYISLLERGKRKGSVVVIGNLCRALAMPDYILALLATEPGDLNNTEIEAAVKILSEFLIRTLWGKQIPT